MDLLDMLIYKVGALPIEWDRSGLAMMLLHTIRDWCAINIYERQNRCTVEHKTASLSYRKPSQLSEEDLEYECTYLYYGIKRNIDTYEL